MICYHFLQPTKQQSNKATKQQSNKATKQQSNKATKQQSYDAILFAHSLYLVDPCEIPLVIANAICMLRLGGYILIYDFDSFPQKQKYVHAENIYTYKAHFDQYFTWHPQMHLVKKIITEHDGSATVGNPKENCALSVIRKISLDNAFPEIIGDIKIANK